MAAATKSEPEPPTDLTRCGICKEIINHPKTLTCLHTFCLECLREWYKKTKAVITCPVLDCKKTTPIPSNGVDGLPDNNFVSSLVDMSPYRGRNVPCVCCDETNNDVLARCVECNGLLCKKGVDLHQERLLKSHQVIRLEDIKSSQINTTMLAEKYQATCKDHKGSTLWFYCVTCSVLICRDCVIVDHAKPDHNYVTLKIIAMKQRKKIEELVKQNEVIRDQVSTALQNLGKARTNLETSKQKLSENIDREIEKIEVHVRTVCQEERRRLLKQHEVEVAAANTTIQLCTETLKSQNVRVQTAIEVANQALQKGSDGDIASVYKLLKNSLDELGKEKVMSGLQCVRQLPKFEANSKFTEVTTIGAFAKTTTIWKATELPVRRKTMPQKPLDVQWERTCILIPDGNLTNARGIATAPNGNLVIASWSSGEPVKVYNSNGQYQFSMNEQSCYAWDVAVSPTDGKIYVTCNSAKHVRVFGSDGEYDSQFETVVPSDIASDGERKYRYLRGLAINSKQQLLVGANDLMEKYISIHDLNGTHITSFSVTIGPQFIATTSQGNIVVSHSIRTSGEIHVLDSNGRFQHAIDRPTDARYGWVPRGVCCGRTNNEIYISSWPSIFCFFATGEYLRCIGKDLSNTVWGLTLSQEDRKLLVVDYGGRQVIMYSRK